MSVPFFNLTRQIKKIKEEIGSALSEVAQSGKFILGPNVSRLEQEIASYCGVKFAVAVASGTDALHLSLRACGIKAGDEVLCPVFTFVAPAEAIAYLGAKPVFVDIDPQSFNIDPAQIEEKLTSKTKAIIPVHLFGQPAEMGPILEIAKKHKLKVIEDCAQAFGAEYNSRKTGSFGETGCFSFFPTKNLGCFGDGGMIITNCQAIYDYLKILHLHGTTGTYKHEVVGYNSRLDEIQAAVLRVKLKYVDFWAGKRQKNAQLYNSFLKDEKSIKIPSIMPNSKHIFNQYTIRISGQPRSNLIVKLKQKSIGFNIYYPISLHLQKAFEYLGYKKGDFPNAERVQEEALSLPIFPELSEKEIEEACSAVKDLYK